MINKALFLSAFSGWETPKELFTTLNKKYRFTLDPCCTKENAKCRKYYTKEDDGLAQSWKGERVFVNPPYGKNIRYWVAKCFHAAHDEGAKIVVALLPARTDTVWFHTFILGEADISFLRGRVKFEQGGKPCENSAPFPSMIVVWTGQ